jgi:dihydrofolate synthase/folylpolyglutamate synthase
VNFNESEAYLLSLGNEVSTMKLGLENIRKLLGALRNPQNNYLKVQVAGTNGKGSVCTFLSSICVSAGIKTGMYTSPHLVKMTERVKIDGTDIAEEDFARLATRVREVSESLVDSSEIENIPTYFEQVTAIALLAFVETKVEIGILVTGLGGRCDATTAADAEIAAITRIDLDHQQYLGETIEEIAAEKAAIIHPGSQVIVGEQVPDAMKIILERCREVGANPHLAAVIIEGGNATGWKGVAALINAQGGGSVGKLGLQGRHQFENAATAAAIARVLRDRFPITEQNVLTGLQESRHPGRLEWIGRYLLDGAHNVGGARALRKYLDEFVPRPITLVFGAMSDKDVGEIASVLFPKAGRLILTTPDNSRAAKAESLLNIVDFDPERLYVTPDAAIAIEKAREVAGEHDVILITGSLYLVGEMRNILTSGPSEETEN